MCISGVHFSNLPMTLEEYHKAGGMKKLPDSKEVTNSAAVLRPYFRTTYIYMH